MNTIGDASARAPSGRGSTHVATTLYDIIAALQTTGELGEDERIVARVAFWVRSGRIAFSRGSAGTS